MQSKVCLYVLWPVVKCLLPEQSGSVVTRKLQVERIEYEL